MASAVIRTPFTGDEEADRLLTDNPLALLVGMLLDQQVPMEWAFRGPWELKQRLGGRLDAGELAAMDADKVRAVFSERPALHRYPGSMGERVHQLCQFVVDRYRGDASRIWRDAADPAEVFANLRELPGYGEQKAKIFLSILGKRLGVLADGWERLAGDYGKPGYRSIADVDGPGTIERVREYKQAMKQKAKAPPT